MRYIVLFFFLFPLSAGLLFSQNGTIEMVTYNIRLDFEGDGKDNWHYRKTDMVNYLQELSPDFIGLQEAMFGQLAYLDEHLNNYAYIGQGRDGVLKGEFSPILFDSTKWTKVHDGVFWLSETPDEVSIGWDAAYKRICTYAVFQNEQNFQIGIFNTHLDHVGKTARENSVLLILDRMEQYTGSIPLVLMGDFNFDPGDNNYGIITSKMMDCATMPEVPVQTGTFNGFKLKQFPERRIDYIFTDYINGEWEYRVERPLTEKGRQLSDHFPVIAELKIK